MQEMASERNLKTGEAQVLQKLHSIGKSSQIGQMQMRPGAEAYLSLLVRPC